MGVSPDDLVEGHESLLLALEAILNVCAFATYRIESLYLRLKRRLQVVGYSLRMHLDSKIGAQIFVKIT